MHQSKHSGPTNDTQTGSVTTNANREMLRFIQRRKFRLVTQWKVRLKQNITFQLPTGPDFPYRLVFRTFDEVIRLLKSEMCGAPPDFSESLLADHREVETPNADQFMEMFLTGRDVLGEFVSSDKTFCASFPVPLRSGLRTGIERVLKELVEREMNEFSRLQNPGFPPENRNPA